MCMINRVFIAPLRAECWYKYDLNLHTGIAELPIMNWNLQLLSELSNIYRRFNYLSERGVGSCFGEIKCWRNLSRLFFAVVLWWKLYFGLLCDFRPTMFAMMGAKVTKAPLSCAPMALCSIRRSSPATGGTMSTAPMRLLSTGMCQNSETIEIFSCATN